MFSLKTCLGMLIATCGSICVGVGLSFQKLALTASDSAETRVTSVSTASTVDHDFVCAPYGDTGSPYIPMLGFEHTGWQGRILRWLQHRLPPFLWQRLSKPRWIVGMALCMTGEVFGSTLGLMLASPAVIAPLSIAGVITNSLLAARWLGEDLPLRKLQGYGLIALAVLTILSIAPEQDAATWPPGYVVVLVMEPRTWLLLTACAVLLGSMAYLMRSHHISMIPYLVVCSVLGACTIIMTKLMGALASESVRQHSGLLVTMEPTILTKVHPSTQRVLAAMGLVWFVCVVMTETTKQMALERFASSAFIPAHYAIHNLFVTLASLYIFRDLHTFRQMLVFGMWFALALTLMCVGLRMGNSQGAVWSVLPGKSPMTFSSPYIFLRVPSRSTGSLLGKMPLSQHPAIRPMRSQPRLDKSSVTRAIYVAAPESGF
jgi:hypothetical protein